MKPILFNTDMVRAIMDGRKTVTRRAVKPQPAGNAEIVPSPIPWYGFENDTDMWHIKPPYRPGDILYVREAWVKIDGEYVFRADDEMPEGWHLTAWHPSIHMPKEAARIFLRVTDVRVERLQDITEEQAQKEGLYRGWKPTEKSTTALTAKQAFMWVWYSTVKLADRASYGWIANPWVWVIEFERIGIGREETLR